MLALWIVWAALALLVAGLALYRKFESHFHEDDLVHLAEGEAKFIPNQVATGRLLDKVDSWGKVLTAVVVVYGFALVAFVLYGAWVQSQKMLTH